MEHSTVPAPAILPGKEVTLGEAKSKLFAPFIALCCVLFVNFSLFGGLTFGFTLSFVALFAVCLVYQLTSAIQLSFFTLLCGLFALLGAVVFTLYTNFTTNFFLFWLILAATMLFFLRAGGAQRFSSKSYQVVFDILIAFFYLPFAQLGNSLRSVFSPKEKASRGRGWKVLLAILVTIPILSVIIPLLMSSDAAFESLMQQLAFLRFESWGEILFSLAFGLPLSLFLFSAMYALHSRRVQPKVKAKDPLAWAHAVDSAAVNVVLGIISIFYLVYLLSQLLYFFSAFSGILPAGFSTADYARRGFFEMLAIGLINLALVFCALMLAKRRQGQPPLGTRLLCTFMLLFTMVLIGTALSKMLLYINAWGMTPLRLFTSVFMVMLFILCLCVLIRLFAPRFAYMKAALSFSLILYLAMAFCDIDTVVSRYNVWAYQTGRLDSVDTSLLGSLSDSAVPSLIELLDDENKEVRDGAAYELYIRVIHEFHMDKGQIIVYDHRPVKDFRSYNVSVARANQLLYSEAHRYYETGQAIYQQLYFDDHGEPAPDFYS